MALRIFDTDPASRPKPRQFPDDVVGRFRSGRMVGTRPEALSEWRVTTGDPEVAAEVAELLGGEPAEWQTTGEDYLEVLTDAESVRVVIDGPDALSADMKLWGPRGQLVHHCDGVSFLSPDEDAGKPCGCPELLADRKAYAKSGRGPSPSVNLVFRLAANTGLGLFRFGSSSWKLAEVVHEINAALTNVGGPARSELTLELVQFRTKAGVDVAFRKPTVKVLGPWNAETAE
ncbi:hypothetical protein D7319_11250 [Streptomyces radicis]|uniref:Uncharacterized protein n=1 Tax=Streptomyces radicis TaxID=1750517 RepID=A0A3A9WB86_9ACTN|nr:hypothetical protein D7319_11250 [Streptomyces radicis]